MIFDELKRSFRRNRWYSLCAFLLMALSLLLTMVALSEFSRVQARSDFAQELSNKNYYRLHDNFVGEEETLFFQQQDNVTRLKELYKKLKSTSAFQYLSMVSQPIYVKNLAVGNQFLDGYEDNAIQKDVSFSETDTGYSAFTSIQLEWEAISHFKLTVLESNKELLGCWDAPDFARIPVLLGSEYRGLVHLGDTFPINYLGMSAKIEVAGFLAPGSSLVDKGDMASLNRCILFPALQLGNPLTAAEKEIQMRIYLQKLSGTIVSGQTPDEVQKIVTDLCTQCDLQPFFVDGARGALELFGMEAQKFAALFLAFSLLLTVFSAMVLTLVMTIKIREQLPTYAVHLVCGAGLTHIWAYIAAEVLSLLAVSAAIAAAAAYLLTGGTLRLLPVSLGICGLIGICTCLVPMLLVKRQSLNGRLGRNY